MTASVIPSSPSREDYARDYAAALAANGDETIFARIEPIGLFVDWLADARAHEPNDPNAMTLSTVDADGLPDARIVLLKDVDARGFTFYSNSESAKGVELAGCAAAALTFHWKSLRRQVRVRGAVQPVSAEEADAYFASRARESRIGAWASDQSAPWRTARCWKRRSAAKPHASTARTCRVPNAGPAGASCRNRSSSGATGRFACTIACGSTGTATPGKRSASGPDRAQARNSSDPSP